METAALPVHLLLLLPLLAIVSFLWLRRAASGRRRSGRPRLPPSPWALPVIGHLHHLAGLLPHRAMRDLATRHCGPVMLLRLGGLPVVVASTAAAAREVMKSRDLELASRPVTRMVRLAIPDGAEGIVFAPYGDAWRQIRKICAVELLSARRVQSFRSVREEEARRLLLAVASSAAQAETETAVNLSELLAVYAADSSVRAMIGSRFEDRRGAFLAMLERGLKLFANMSLPDLYPSSRLAMLVSRMPRRMKEHRREVVKFMDAMVRDHGESRGAGDDDKEDLLDVLLRIQRDGDLQFPLTTDNIKSVVGDLFAGGSETSATTLQWIMAELMRNPRVMKKAQDEVRQAVAVAGHGQQRVTEDDLSSLHYMRLVIKEALRLHPPLPLLLPRECRSSSCQVLGFDVPVGTVVFVNAWAIGRDPGYWDRPEEFLPERFEDSSVDFKGTDFEYVPFGAGRRMCPGMTFGLVTMELALASLLYHFDWELPPGMTAMDIDMTEEMGVTARRLHDLLLVPFVRVSVPMT